jgi:uncharacterized repeat protein (TIGR01451 family)
MTQHPITPRVVATLLVSVATLVAAPLASAGQARWSWDSGLPSPIAAFPSAQTIAELPGGALVLAVSGGGMFVSYDGANSWDPAEVGPAIDPLAHPTIATTASSETVAYAALGRGVSSSEVWRTFDGGFNWRRLAASALSDCPGPTLAVDAADWSIVYESCGIGNTFERSADGGATWQAEPDGLDGIDQLAATAGVVWAVSNPPGRATFGDSLFRSHNGGASWSSEVTFGGRCVDPRTCVVHGVMVDPSSPDTIYARVDTNLDQSDETDPAHRLLLRSVDNGATWTELTSGWVVDGLAAISATGRTLVLVSDAGPFALSHDAGATWQTATLPEGLTPTSLVVSADDPASLVARVVPFENPETPILRSVDGGLTWSFAGRGLDAQQGLALAVSSADPSRLLAAVGTLGAAAGTIPPGSLYGDVWQAAGGLTDAITLRSGLSVVSDPGAPGRVFLGSGEGIFVSHDDGGSYSPTALTTGEIDALAIDPASDALFAGARGGGLWRSTDGGGSFEEADSGLPSATIYALATTGAGDARALLAGTDDGVYRSVDAGEHWIASPLASTFVDAIAVDPTDPSTVYAAACGDGPQLSVSHDGGLTWSDTGADLPTCVTSLALDGADADLVYAGTFGAGVWSSVDQGASWSPLNSGLAESANGNPGSGAATSLWMSPDGTALHAGMLDGLASYAFLDDVWTSVTVSPASVSPGAPVSYDVVFGNDGPDDASNVTGALDLPGGVTLPGATQHCSGASTVTCTVRTLAAGDGLELVFTSPAPQTPGTYPITSTIRATPRRDLNRSGDQGTATLTVTPPTPSQTRGTPDTTPPDSVQLLGAQLGRVFQVGTALTLGFAAHDDAPGALQFDLRERSAPARTGFGPYRTVLSAATGTQTRLELARGTTACFSLRARDASANTSDWTSERCTAIPLGASQLRRHGAWRASASTSSDLGPLETTSSLGATLTLTGVSARRLALVATRCATCGAVTVSFAGHRVATISLTSKRAAANALIQLHPFAGVRRGTLVITSISRGRPVRVQGVGISAR